MSSASLALITARSAARATSSPTTLMIRPSSSSSSSVVVVRASSGAVVHRRYAAASLVGTPLPGSGRARRALISSRVVASAALEETVTDAPEPPKAIFRSDYAPPPYTITDVKLRFELGENSTTVTSTMQVSSLSGDAPLELVGEELKLLNAKLNGEELPEGTYTADASGFSMAAPPQGAPFTLELTTEIHPESNTKLEGLYKSSGNFCTQCEAEGFRRITYFLDRPDVMALYETTIVADKEAYPILLGNGNLISSGDAEDGKHFAVWEDPFPKPSYLFALVAGDLAQIEDTFTTMSGRDVTLRIFCQEHNIHKCDYAMDALKRSMKWDEDTYGLEYDLDLFNIVAVDDFNMGAMENKSLNVFNSR